ncbi:MAG: PQQ-like beta-propeller repeat protein [Rickettsiales bacterium]|nr:PQQ-like beta-propeller repeat protein [Rickettsiales bacterium]
MKKSAPLLFLVATLSIFSCSKDADYDKEKAISAFTAIDAVRVDELLEKVEIKIPTQQKNLTWSGSSSSQNQQIENFEKNFAIGSWSKKISFDKSSKTWSFYSGTRDDRFVFSPIIKDQKVFILNSGGTLISYDLKADKKIWKTRIFHRQYLKNYQTPKIGYSNGKIFAIAGINKIAAVDEADGKILWSKDISAIPVSSPVVDGELVYVTTNDNKLYAFNVNDGELQWTQSGILRATAIFGAADPVIYKNLVIVSYSSGEVYAVNKKTGEAMWSQNLNISKATNSDFYLNDVDATPVVKDDVIYAIGNGGLMMAMKVKDGNYLWKKEIAGIVDFWLAGDFLFVINNDNKLLSVSKKTGGIKWILQLPNLKKENKPQTKILYSGVVMAGDKLLIAESDGKLLVVNPITVKIEKTYSIGKKISHTPVVVNGKIYFYVIGKFLIDLIEIE